MCIIYVNVEVYILVHCTFACVRLPVSELRIPALLCLYHV